MATRPFEIKIADKDIKAILSTFKNMDDMGKCDPEKQVISIRMDILNIHYHNTYLVLYGTLQS